MENKLKIYVNRNLLSDKISYSPLLFPFFGPLLKETTPYISAVFKKWNFDKNYYDLVENVFDADFVFIPHNYWAIKKNKNLLSEFILDAQKNRKPILIDAYGDSAEPINIQNSCALRTSQYKFQKKENEIIIPAYTEDLLENYCAGKIQVRKKESLPLVSFMGFADLSWKHLLRLKIKNFLNYFKQIFKRNKLALNQGIFFRKKAIAKLSQSKKVVSNFVVRKFYSGHIGTIKGEAAHLRNEFVNNIVNSDYVLCIKGDGNFSYRFYETLSLGRIPLLVDTECVLPLEDIICYKDFCFFVDFRDLKNIDKILFDFHQKISGEKFEFMQREARAVFEEYLRIDNFTSHMVSKLTDFLKK